MSERPILFSTAMVQAILAGRKSQTRRVIKNVPSYVDYFAQRGGDYGAWRGYMAPGEPTDFVISLPERPGGVLWVKETWTYITLAESEFDPTNPLHRRKPDGYPVFMVYRADGDEIPAAWSPSMFMPKWASRLRLTVTAVRLERLQDITLGGIAAEGWPDAPQEDMVWLPDLPEIQMAGFEWFSGVWDSINAGKGFPFKNNPFVKVIAFNVVGSSPAPTG